MTLTKFLDSHRVTGPEWNITGLAKADMGKYMIPNDEYDTFLDLVHDHIFVNHRACSLLEKHLPQSPILIDLDFKYAAGGPLRRRFTGDHIRQFVAAYANAFARFLELPGELQFFVMLKPSAEREATKDSHKDGIHIVCPTITTTHDIQFALRGWMLQSGVIEAIFGPTEMTNDAQDCFDISVISRNNWFLYGGGKQDKASYEVVNVYSISEVPEGPVEADDLEELSVDQWSPKDLIKLLSIRNGHNSATEITVREENTTEWQSLLSRWGAGTKSAVHKTPTIHSKKGGALPAFDLSNTIQNVENVELIQMSGLSVREPPNDCDVKIAYRLVLECMNPDKRVGDYHSWFNLGVSLHNTSHRDESFSVWMEFSRRAAGNANNPESIYREKWNLIKAASANTPAGKRILTIGSIRHWAKEDNLEKYRDIIKKANEDRALVNINGSHVSVAEQVCYMFGDEFRCNPPRKGASAGSMDWSQFEGHTWKALKTCMKLREKLSNEVRKAYIHAENVITKQRGAEDIDETAEKMCEEKQKKLRKIQDSLYNNGFKNSVMNECVEKFYDEDFVDQMNKDATLLGFANGVLELRHVGTDGNLCTNFRDGRPDDCISFQMGRGIAGGQRSDGIPYKKYDPNDPSTVTDDHREILDFFAKIYPDEVLREYVLTLFSSCLEGANREQKFYIMTGIGSNGKSKMVELMSTTFGEYQEVLSTTALTRKRPESGAANPDLVVLKCKRFVSMSEPDEGEKINTSSMKQLSGEDTVKARALFQDQDQFVIMAKIFMLCNELPPVASMDNGTWRRLRVIPHVACFVDKDKPTDPDNHIHHKDLLLDSKIRKWRPAFAGILVWYYENRYLRGGLREPEHVTMASRKYKEENDSFAAFAQDCLVREFGAEVRANDIITRYKEWSKFNPGKKALKKEQLLQRMGEMFGKPVDSAGKVYAGVRMSVEDEDMSGNVIATPS